MASELKPRDAFAITNANKPLVVEQLDKLRKEWSAWLEHGQGLGDSTDFDPNTCTECIKDGYTNLRKHEVLREKTLVFIANNFAGYGFLFENWPNHPHEDVTSRIVRKAPGWMHRLDTLAACIEFARVPDGYWTAKGKQLIDALAKAGPNKAVDIATSYLKSP